MEDAMELQKELGQENYAQIIIEKEENDAPDIVLECRPNWMLSIIHCQKMDSGKYGSTFPFLPSFINNDNDARILWILTGMITFSWKF